MKNILLVCALFINTNAFARISMVDSDKGNGGSGPEVLYVVQQVMFEDTGLKIKNFFINNESELKNVFPEFEIKALINKINETQIEIVDGDLVDENGKSTPCLNYPTSSKVKCGLSYFTKLSNYPKKLIVRVMHEYLELMVDEKRISIDADFLVSKKILSYLTQVGSETLLRDVVTDFNFGEDTMFMETLTVARGKDSDLSEKKTTKLSQKIIKERCVNRKKKVIFSDVKILSRAEGVVLLRYICD